MFGVCTSYTSNTSSFHLARMRKRKVPHDLWY
jgi:hypothetical protein